MNRRGILKGFFVGAVAGPGMVKAAAAQTVADLSLPGVALGLGPQPPYGGAVAGGISDMSWLDRNKRDLAMLLGRSMDWHKAEMRKTHVSALDPDLAAMRAPSLSWKMRVQQERNYWREVDGRKSWFQSIIEEHAA